MSRRPKKNPKTTPSVRDQILADFTTLRVPVNAEQLDEALQKAQDAGWSHLEFLHQLLADQAGLRRARRIERLINAAKFREALPLSTFDWSFNPSIPRLKIEALAQGDFIRRKQNVVFVGQSGLGKSRLIQSIGLAACMLEQHVRYITSGELLADLTAALADQTIHDRVRFYAKFALLIIDEFAFDRIERAVCPQAASLWYKIILPVRRSAPEGRRPVRNGISKAISELIVASDGGVARGELPADEWAGVPARHANTRRCRWRGVCRWR
jgi:DNA replication protein DnaC